MTIKTRQAGVFRVADLSQNRPTPFLIVPDEAGNTAIAAGLGLQKLRKLRFEGEIRTEGKDGWRLDGALGATVVQSCVVTLDPVTSRIEETVLRRFLPPDQLPLIEDEAETPEDDSIEPLGPEIAAWDIMCEALALALPPYPRKDDAELGEAVFAEPGTDPLRDSDLKPFAGLAGLRDKLAQDDTDTDE